MLQFPFGFRSTKQQYMTLMVVPLDSCRSNDISVDDSVDKPVQRAFDSAFSQEGSPDRRPLPDRSRASGLLIRAIDKADATTDARTCHGDARLQLPEARGTRTHFPGSLFLRVDEQ